MKRAIITGVGGQDGWYLAKLLLGNGYHVLGLSRNVSKVEIPVGVSKSNHLELLNWNPCESVGLKKIVDEFSPSEIYNLAALSSGDGMFENPVDMAEVNGIAVTRWLEVLRLGSPATRFLQASSREVFGNAECSPQNEYTVRAPRSPYGAAKLYADNIVKIYRENYGLFCASAILYNHDSPRRGPEFVTGKVARAAAEISRGIGDVVHLGSLDSRRDWGYAGDFVEAMYLMLQCEAAEDLVISTGVVHTVRELCEIAFSFVGLDYRLHVVESAAMVRGQESVELRGDSKRAKRVLGWSSTVGFEQVIQMMVEDEIKAIESSSENRKLD